jgi:rhodanese-related sulfurtransferase
VKVQTIEIKNRALKSSCISINITSIDLDKFVSQRPSNKSGLGYEKSSKTINYNYYCHIGHISFDCKMNFRESNITNIVWVPKIKN